MERLVDHHCNPESFIGYGRIYAGHQPFSPEPQPNSDIQFCFVEDWYWATNGIPALIWQPQKAEEGCEEILADDFSRNRPVTMEDYTQRSFFFKLAVRSARLLAPIL